MFSVHRFRRSRHRSSCNSSPACQPTVRLFVQRQPLRPTLPQKPRLSCDKSLSSPVSETVFSNGTGITFRNDDGSIVPPHGYKAARTWGTVFRRRIGTGPARPGVTLRSYRFFVTRRLLGDWL